MTRYSVGWVDHRCNHIYTPEQLWAMLVNPGLEVTPHRHWVTGQSLPTGDITSSDECLTPSYAEYAIREVVARYGFIRRLYYGLINHDTNMVLAAAYHDAYGGWSETWYNPAGPLGDNQSQHPLTITFTDTQLPLHREGNSSSMINLNLKREAGKLMLYVNAKELHDDLDAIGATFTGNRYNNRPPTTNSVGDARTNVMSTDVLLTREYPFKVDLTGLWSSPPSYNNLKKFCESAHDQTRKILEHYQPIDIAVEIQKKLVG